MVTIDQNNASVDSRSKDVPTLQHSLADYGNYITDLDLATTIFLSIKMRKPILFEGPAGVGKTEVAKALSKVLKRPLVRMQCYEGLDESRALYEWEYGKQLLFTQILRDKIAGLYQDTNTLQEAVEQLGGEESVFFSEKFLLERPLLKAIRSPEPTVLLIDEIDKADQEFEAFLLELLSDFQVTIPEIGTVEAVHLPIVILTSNQARELSEALKRRCLYYYIDYPEADREQAIVRKHMPDISDELGQSIVNVVQKARLLELRKKPSVSETIEWAESLLLVGAKTMDADVLKETLCALAKHKTDTQKLRDNADELVRP